MSRIDVTPPIAFGLPMLNSECAANMQTLNK